VDKRKRRVSHPQVPGSLTQKHFAEATDINRIMARVHAGGALAGAGRPSGEQLRYGSLTGASYHEMLVRLQQVQGSFAALPAKVRKRFANNPENMLSFLEDGKNITEAVSLGLIDPDSATAEQVEQLDLARQAERQDREEFAQWQREKRAKLGQPPWDENAEADANSMPGHSDEEANPRNSRKKRT